jgi:hypothetical protein
MPMMLSLKLRNDTAAVESAEALEQVNAADADVAYQSWCCCHVANAAAE